MRSILNRLSDIEAHRFDVIAAEKKKGKPLIVYNSTFVPEELIRAAGANTYLMCRGGEAAAAEMAIDYTLECINPMARASVSYISCGMDELAGMADMVVTAFSDSHMSRMSELLEYRGINVFKIGVPTDWQKKISFEYYLHSLKAMMKKVETITGREMDEKLARDYFMRSNRIKACTRRINALRKTDEIPLGIEDVVRLHHMSFVLNGAGEAGALEELVECLEKAPPVFEKDAPRLLMIMRAIPAGDYEILRIIDESGCPVVAEVMDECACVSDSDVELDGDLIENFAKSRYTMALPLNSFQPSWKIRFERICSLIKEYRVDGVIWYQLAYDEIYDMEYVCVSKWLGELNIPVTKIETDFDYTPEKLSAKKAQINSFIKNVKKRRCV